MLFDKFKFKITHNNLLNLYFKNINKNTIIILYKLNLKISKNFINNIIFLYNGRNFMKYKINNYIVGKKIGQICFTRKPNIYINKIKKKIKR